MRCHVVRSGGGGGGGKWCACTCCRQSGQSVGPLRMRFSVAGAGGGASGADALASTGQSVKDSLEIEYLD